MNKSQQLGQALLGMVLVGVGLCVAGANVQWVKNVMAGPVAVSTDQLWKLQDPKTLANPWVKVDKDRLVETKYGVGVKKYGQTTNRSRFYLIKVVGRFAVAELPTDPPGKEVTGYLTVWTDPLRKEAIERLEGEFSWVRGKLLPYQFDGAYAYKEQCCAMLVACVAMVLIGLYLICIGVGPSSAPKPYYPGEELLRRCQELPAQPRG